MMQGFFGEGWGMMPLGFGWFGPAGFFGMSILLAWSVAWKGLALWRAARRGENVWFIALLVINTAGILEILYIYVFSKDQPKPVAEAMPAEGEGRK